MMKYRLTNYGFRRETEPEHQWFVTIGEAREAARDQHLVHWGTCKRITDGNLELVDHICRV